MSEAFTGPTLAFSRNSKFSFEDYDDVEPSTKPWLIRNAWPMRGVAWIAGASGAAKTFYGIDALASHGSWFKANPDTLTNDIVEAARAIGADWLIEDVAVRGALAA